MIKKYDLLYDWPLDKIEHLSNSASAEEFAGGLVGAALDEFTALTEQIRAHGAAMRAAKAARDMFTQWNALGASILLFEQSYPEFPALETKKLQLSLILGSQLSVALPVATGGVPVLNEDEIDNSLFEWRKLEGDLDVAWFAHQNAKSFQDSLVLMDVSNVAALAQNVGASTMSPELLFHSIAAWHTFGEEPAGHLVLVKMAADPIATVSVTAFAKLAVLASGMPIHRPYNYAAARPRVLDVDAIKAGEKYQQFGDVLDVFSEYNSRPELLAKYLTLYHVIENFMVRLSIVRLERENQGRMFSIRDFQRLYQQIERNELAALQSLCDEVFSLDAKPGVTFNDHLMANWNALARAAQVDLDDALARLGLRKGKGQLLKCNDFTAHAVAFSSHLAKLIYAVRNAIVHNKATEFHLTFATLDASLKILLEQFLVPSLEELCFALVTENNTQLWYSRPELALYKE
jgi:hypothetical protein